MRASRLLLSTAVLGLAAAGTPAVSAQDPKSDPEPASAGQGQVQKDEGTGAPPGRPGGRGPRGMPSMPKPGPTELPILPALAALADTSFFARADVPHGKVEPATYTNHAGKEKRMQV